MEATRWRFKWDTTRTHVCGLPYLQPAAPFCQTPPTPTPDMLPQPGDNWNLLEEDHGFRGITILS